MSGECDRCGEHAVECECHRRTPTTTNPKHTSSDLVERLREQAWTITHMEAADRIEALSAEVERLRADVERLEALNPRHQQQE